MTRRVCAVAGVFFVVGCAIATFLYWPALTNPAIYHTDVRQSPHWAAYHTTSFLDDDMILAYASFNETPLQNMIYWVGTAFVDFIALGNYLTVIGFGLLVAMFFVIGNAMYGMRVGCLAAVFIACILDAFEFCAGFYSKFWMLPVLLLTVFLLHTRRWLGLIPLMAFAAIAYPMTAVLIGMICSVHAVQLFFVDRPASWRLFRGLVIASLVSGALLGFKYLSLPEFLGPKQPQVELLAAMRARVSPYVPIPSLLDEIVEQFGHPLHWGASLFYVVVLRRRLLWEREWTSLLVASAVGYVLADYFFMTLYIPNRYTRYSVIVFLALWHATQLGRVLEKIRVPSWRRVATVGAVVMAFLVAGDSRPGDETTDSGVRFTQLCEFVETLPEGILLAGPPRYMDDLMIRSKRSALTAFKLNHLWYSRYQAELRERTLATFEAMYAEKLSDVNLLHERYGVTHLVVGREYFERILERGRGLKSRYDREVRRNIIGARTQFALPTSPIRSVVYIDADFMVIELPVHDGAEAAVNPG